MTWVLFFGIIIGDHEIRSYTFTDPRTCRHIELGYAMKWRPWIFTDQYGFKPVSWAKCVRKEPTA